MQRHWKLAILSAVGVLTLSACSFDASIVDENTSTVESYPFNRSEPDGVAGEEIVTNNGYHFRGALGEISEKKQLANGYQFEGAFYPAD